MGPSRERGGGSGNRLRGVEKKRLRDGKGFIRGASSSTLNASRPAENRRDQGLRKPKNKTDFTKRGHKEVSL